MKKTSLKEKIFFGLVCNEQRVYRHWYSRFLLAQVDIDRIHRVVKRTRNWFHWLDEWSKEGVHLNSMAEKALSEGNILTARNLFHEAAGCYHIGQHFFYFDDEKKTRAMHEIWRIYKQAIALYPDSEQPERLEIPFRDTVIPGYLRLQEEKDRPLIILINGMDNIKEIEQHYWANLFVEAGLNTFVFDGPGQGEKELVYYPDGEHVCANYLDEVIPKTIDWLLKQFNMKHLKLNLQWNKEKNERMSIANDS